MCHLLAKCSTPSAIFTSFIFVLFFKCCTLVTNTTTTQKHQCRDGRENLAEARSDRKSHYPVVIKHLRGTLYRPNNRPACYNGRATVLMPGVAKLFEGEMTVPQRHFDLVKSGTIRMTIKSPSFDDPICLNGSSQYKFLPDSMCSFNVCEFIGKDLCEFLQEPGIHTIREMEQKLHFNSTLLLPDPPSFLGISLLDILAGEFSFVMALETEGQTILELNIPTNERFLQIGLEEEENDDCN